MTANRWKKNKIQKKSKEDTGSMAKIHDAIYVYLANDENTNMFSLNCCRLNTVANGAVFRVDVRSRVVYYVDDWPSATAGSLRES